MAPSPDVPRPLVVLGDAWRPIVDKFHERLEFEPRQTRRPKDMIDLVQRHLDEYLDESQQFVVECESLFNLLSEQFAQPATDPDAAETTIRRAVARVERCLDRLLIGYHAVLRVKPGPLDAGWSILIDAYRHTLLDIREILDREQEFLADPIVFNRNRGLPTTTPIQHVVDLDLSVITPDDVEALHRWASDPASHSETQLPWWSAPLTLLTGYALIALLAWWWWEEITSPIGMILLLIVGSGMVIAWFWGRLFP